MLIDVPREEVTFSTCHFDLLLVSRPCRLGLSRDSLFEGDSAGIANTVSTLHVYKSRVSIKSHALQFCFTYTNGMTTRKVHVVASVDLDSLFGETAIIFVRLEDNVLA